VLGRLASLPEPRTRLSGVGASVCGRRGHRGASLVRRRPNERTEPGQTGRSHRLAAADGRRTRVRAPKANAVAGRFVRTARAEWRDWFLILS
jgi:hypothetical protein